MRNIILLILCLLFSACHTPTKLYAAVIGKPPYEISMLTKEYSGFDGVVSARIQFSKIETHNHIIDETVFLMCRYAFDQHRLLGEIPEKISFEQAFIKEFNRLVKKNKTTVSSLKAAYDIGPADPKIAAALKAYNDLEKRVQFRKKIADEEINYREARNK